MIEKSQESESISVKEYRSDGDFNFERKKSQKLSQLLSMKRFKVHKDISQRQVTKKKNSLRKRNASKLFDQSFEIDNQEEIISYLCKRKQNVSRQSIQKQQIQYLNIFYTHSSNQIGIIQENDKKIYKLESYCKNPSIIFTIEQNSLSFANILSNQKFLSKRLIAKAFVYYDYGYGSFTLWMKQKEQQQAMQFSKYRKLVAVIMTQCYRRLQNFVIQQCCMNIRRLNRAQIKLILIILLNCRQRIKYHFETYLQYVKLCFFLEDVTITAKKSVQLYQAIYEALKKRVYQKSGQSMNEEQRHPGTQSLFNSKGGFTHNQRFQLHKIWNGDYEREFLEFYENSSDLQSIARAFHRKYPNKKLFFNEFSLKLRLNKMLRQSLKNMQQHRKSELTQDLPELQKLSKNSFKAILENGNLYGIRLMLLQISKAKICKIQLVKQAIITLNQFISASQPFEKKVYSKNYSKKEQAKIYQQSSQYSIDMNLEGEQQSQINLNEISDCLE